MTDELSKNVKKAVKSFWNTRLKQDKKQKTSGKTDQGSRGAATGGAQLDGFVNLVKSILLNEGIPEESIHCKQRITLPGYFRPTKKWDLLVIHNSDLIASIEFKSHVGPSFGNNTNNRTEEALGSATDLRTAYREGVFMESVCPWLGFLILLEEHPKTTSSVRLQEPHFKVLPEFQCSSYEKRYEILCHKLIRERLYDAACFILSDPKNGLKGKYKEPSPDLNFKSFTASLLGKAIAYMKIKGVS